MMSNDSLLGLGGFTRLCRVLHPEDIARRLVSEGRTAGESDSNTDAVSRKGSDFPNAVRDSERYGDGHRLRR